MTVPRRVGVLVAAWLVALTLVTPTASAQTWLGATYEAVVARVVDGDTIHVQIGDRVETVRYIGINTPEIHHPTRGPEPYGAAARTANQQLVEGRTVRLMLDVQPRDPYGRLLAYVYVDGQLVNAELVRSGYAEAATYPPNVKHHAEFVELQRQARQARVGLWRDPEAIAAHRPRASGVVGVKHVRVYLHPDDPNWQRHDPNNIQYFESVDEARAAGYTHSADYQRHREREQQALSGGSQPYVSAGATAPGPSGISPPRSSGGPPPSSDMFMSSPRSSGSPPPPGRDVDVRGYTRRDGTYVPPHTRSAPRSR
jgi:micrococcal nuclease